MKILHLTTSRSGGAGVAALRLARAQQRDLRSEVQLLTSQEGNNLIRGFFDQKRKLIQSKSLTAYQQIMATKEVAFVSPMSVSKLSWQFIQDFSPDVVHLHNWYNFLSLQDINLLLMRYKVVFTAHDERLLTGGCHITLGCDRYLQGCISCPQVRFGSRNISKSATMLHSLLFASKNYSIIAPSKWLTEKFQTAKFINPVCRIESIPNLIPLDLAFESKTSEESCTKFLFVTDSSTSSNKGLPEVLEALDKLSALRPKTRFELQIAGIESFCSPFNRPNLRVYSLGILNEDEMQARYRIVDALIVASKSENSPNVISESQIHGAVAIGHAVGGIPELIIHHETGLLYRTGKDSLLSVLIEYIGISEEKRNVIRRAAWEAAVLRHDPIKVLDETYSVYSELLGRDAN